MTITGLPTLHTVEEVARALACSIDAVYREIAEGRLEATIIGRRGKRIRSDRLREWLDSRTAGGGSASAPVAPAAGSPAPTTDDAERSVELRSTLAMLRPRARPLSSTSAG